MILWGCGIPLLLTIITYKMHRRKKMLIKKGIYNYLLSFLTIDYINRYYLWEVFTYLSKFFFVSATVLTSSLEPVSQGAVLILIFLILFLVQERCRPYRFEFINMFKSCSFLTAVCNYYLAIIDSK